MKWSLVPRHSPRQLIVIFVHSQLVQFAAVFSRRRWSCAGQKILLANPKYTTFTSTQEYCTCSAESTHFTYITQCWSSWSTQAKFGYLHRAKVFVGIQPGVVGCLQYWSTLFVNCRAAIVCLRKTLFPGYWASYIQRPAPFSKIRRASAHAPLVTFTFYIRPPCSS